MANAVISALRFSETEPRRARAQFIQIDSAPVLRASLAVDAPTVFVVADSWEQTLLGFRDAIVHEPAVDYDHWDRVLAKMRASDAKAVLKRPKRKGTANFWGTAQAIFAEARKAALPRAAVILTLPHESLLDLAESYGVRLRDVFRDEDVDRLVPLDGTVIPEAIQAGFPGRSPLAHYVRALAAKSIASPIVLLRGPSGAGKRVIAQAIHAAGSPGAPFEAVRCGAFIDDRDLERALFGHTDARATVPGAWERARGGTLFLQEIADLSQPMQKRIATVLRDGLRARAAAGHADVKDGGLRVIASTDGVPEQGDDTGELDDELLFRLLPMSIRVPSLAERGDDFDDIAQAVWLRVGGRNPLPDTIAAALRRRSWRGNVRELKSFLTRLLRRFGGLPTDAQAAGLLDEMDPVSHGWGGEVRLPSPAACGAFLEEVRALLRECSGRLELLDRKPSPQDAEVSALVLAEEDHLKRLRDVLAEPFSFADQTTWRRTRAACDAMSELGDRPPGEIVACWREIGGRRAFEQAEQAVADTTAWLRDLSK